MISMKPSIKVRVMRGRVWLAGEVRETGEVLSLSPLEALEALECARAELVDKGDMPVLVVARAAETRQLLRDARRTPEQPELGPEWSQIMR